MPRRHQAARDRAPPPRARRPSGMAPAWAQAEGFQAREVIGERTYRCPGCQQEIRRGITHLVIVPDHDPGLRRHWHTPCWRRERRANP